MFIQVMSRVSAVEYSCRSHDEASAVISISDYDKNSPTLENNPGNGIVAHLKLKFDDVERGEANCITERDALKIVSFVRGYAIVSNKLIVHCEAGVSRSAGTAAAIMKAINGSDWDIFDNPRYVPNMTCYRMVLDAFYTNGQDILRKLAVDENSFASDNPLDIDFNG